MKDLDTIIETAFRKNASDIHLRDGAKARIRIDNSLAEFPDLPTVNMQSLVDEIFDYLTEDERNAMLALRKAGKDMDCAFSNISGIRLRANIYKTQGGLCAALRIIRPDRLSAGEIGLPFSVTDVCNKKSGLFLVTGANGMGKSTTIAALIDIMNSTRQVHILTIENPIEHVFKSRKALITQREVGTHTPDFTARCARVSAKIPTL